MKLRESQKKIVLFGAGGHAKVVIDAAIRTNRQIHRLFDSDATKEGNLLLGFNVEAYRTPSDISDDVEFIVTIGNNVFRRQWFLQLSKHAPASILIHPSAVISHFCNIEAGTIILGRAIVNSDAHIGSNVIVNTGALIEHDCNIGNHSHVASGATLCGGVSVGECTLIGAGSTVTSGVKIGNNVVIGAGSVVINDAPDGATISGNPARNHQ